jgi:hypothetical protein
MKVLRLTWMLVQVVEKAVSATGGLTGVVRAPAVQRARMAEERTVFMLCDEDEKGS